MANKRIYRYSMPVLALFFALIATGCVSRKLTITTEPEGALVLLNDEEIGLSPVTVGFNWYGDYKVRITKPGYETINTTRLMEPPLHDAPVIDLLADLYPKKIEDHYTWHFELDPFTAPTREQLIERAFDMKARTLRVMAD